MPLLIASLIVSVLAVATAWLATRRDPAGSPLLTLSSFLLLLILPLFMLLPKLTVTLPSSPSPSDTLIASRPILGIFWLLGFTLFALGHLRSHLSLRRWKQETRPSTDPALLPILDECRQRLDFARPVRVLLHPTLGSPAVTGLFRPVIFLPESSRSWSTATLRMVLLHELGHLARRDLWTALTAHLACLLHWFNPLVWRLRKHLLAQCEFACDARVIAAGANRDEYANALCDIAEHPLAPRALLTMASRATLRQRVTRLVDTPRSTTPLLVGSALLLTLSTSLALSIVRLSPPPTNPAYTPEEINLRLNANPFPSE